MVRLRLSARQSEGPLRRIRASVGGCRTWLVVTRDTLTHDSFRGRDCAGLCATTRRRRRHDFVPARQRRSDRPLGLAIASRSTAGDFRAIAGDTLASALLANGVQLMGRSFKYHRPRGVISAGASEPNALVELREGARKEANTRATMVELLRRADRQEPEPLAIARFRYRRAQFASAARCLSPAFTTRPSCGRRASGKKSTSR